MSYVPPHLRRKAVVVPMIHVKKTRFIGNTTGNLNILANNGTRHSPRRFPVTPARRTLKHVIRVSPNAKPPAKPTTAFSQMPPLFQTMLRSRLGPFSMKKTKKTKKTKKAKKAKRGTRRVGRK